MSCYCRWYYTQVGLVNLYDAHKRQSQNLFSGMHCRLSVTMAYINNPDIFIRDEPTFGLDLVFQRQVGVAIFIGYLENNVVLGVFVNVIHYSLFLSLSSFSVCWYNVGGDRESEARSYRHPHHPCNGRG